MKKELIKYELEHGRINPLTGLADRQKLLNSLLGVKSDKLAIININGFWNINHSFGYTVGDELLKIFSERLTKRFASERVYHLGADWFAVLASPSTKNDDFINSLKASLWYFGYSPIKTNGNEFFLSIRIGAAIAIEELFFNSELAIKQAKRLKRDLVVFDKENIGVCGFQSANIKVAIEWENKIREAVKKDRFEVYLQAIKGEKRAKYECLVRMIEPDGKVITPYFFLEHAQKANLYTKITEAVIRKSFEFFSKIDADFSINLTLADILNEDTVNYLYEQMYRYGIAEKLIIELVESEGIENHKEVTNFLSAVKAQGVRIAIDDFGTGYSNFEYLVKLQADYVKIDGSIIKNIHKDSTYKALVETIVSFSGKMGMKTVAEFVSTPEIYETCKNMGIDFFQGYLLHEPSPFSTIAA